MKELARSLARSPHLLFYVRALSIVVDVMRCARAQAAAADDRCGRCCRWMLQCVVGGGAVPSFCTLPPFGLNYLPLPPLPPEIPFGSRSFARRTRGQAGAGGETTTSTAATASTTPSDARPSDRRRLRRAGTFSRPPRQPHIRLSDTHTWNLRSRYAGPRSDYDAAAWPSSSRQRRVVIRN